MGVDLEFMSQARESPLLCELTDDELGVLGSLMEFSIYNQGDVIFEQDTPGDSLLLMVDGRVEVYRKLGERDKVGERLLAVIGKGESVGEMALLDGVPRSATVKAIDACTVLTINSDSYMQLRMSHPQLAIKLTLGIFRILSRRLRQVNKNLEFVRYWLDGKGE
jgi:CRP-like cAMP-binding protein